jgi:tryptophan 2,3-dioxygenase
MTPLQFNSFRDRLDQASGFQSGQFRELEAVFGRRHESMLAPFAVDSKLHRRISAALSRPSLWDSTMRYLRTRKHPIPEDALNRDVSQPYAARHDVTEVVAGAYRSDDEASLVLERLVDLDEGLQEWRYRHVKMVERTIGAKVGTGGSSGAEYLASTLFNPVFPDLWNARQLF